MGRKSILIDEEIELPTQFQDILNETQKNESGEPAVLVWKPFMNMCSTIQIAEAMAGSFLSDETWKKVSFFLSLLISFILFSKHHIYIYMSYSIKLLFF